MKLKDYVKTLNEYIKKNPTLNNRIKMKLKDYVKILNEYIKKNPNYGELGVIYFSDPEGNKVHYVDIGSCRLEYVVRSKQFVEITDSSDHTGIEVLTIN